MKDKYGISLWEDYLVPASTTVPAHYEERKLRLENKISFHRKTKK